MPNFFISEAIELFVILSSVFMGFRLRFVSGIFLVCKCEMISTSMNHTKDSIKPDEKTQRRNKRNMNSIILSKRISINILD